MSATHEPSLLRMLGRAFLRRCPRCGGKGWFQGWFKRVDRCQTCGYRYERAPGFVLGEVTMNTVVTLGLLAAVITVGIVVTYPDVPMLPIMLPAAAVALIVPVAFYPLSSLLWAAIDLKMHPLEPVEEADAATYAAAHGLDATDPPKQGA